jgi:MoxR-like ATPase
MDEGTLVYPVEEVYRTEGVPEYTFVRPPNFNEILVDIRNPGKPVVIEGQSGTGKTTTVKKVIERASGDGLLCRYLSARKGFEIPEIERIAAGEVVGTFVIDDFHRLAIETQVALADRVKEPLIKSRCMG